MFCKYVFHPIFHGSDEFLSGLTFPQHQGHELRGKFPTPGHLVRIYLTNPIADFAWEKLLTYLFKLAEWEHNPNSVSASLIISSDGIHFTAWCKDVGDGSTLIALGRDCREESDALVAECGLIREEIIYVQIGDSVEFLPSDDSELGLKEVVL